VSEPDPTLAGQPSEEELRAAYEAELARVGALDVMLQAAVSLLNVAALRLRPPSGEGQPPPDLEQARDAIDGAAALLGVLEQRVPQDVRPLRDALSQLQMTYARDAQAAGAAPAGGGDGGGGGSGGGEEGPGGGEGGPGGGEGGPGSPGEGSPGATGDRTDPSQRRPGPAESSGRLWVPGT
jgi:hypothetical protein